MKSKIVAIVAYIMLIIGVIVASWGLMPTKQSETVTIPAGEGYYWRWEVSFWMSGHISGDFEVVGAGSVQVYVLNADQFDEYTWDLEPSSMLDSVTGTSGNFSADLPDTSSYYVTLNHGVGYDSIDQEVKMTIKVTGLDLKYLIIGIVVFVIGVVLAVYSRKMKAREAGGDAVTPPVEPKPTDVTMFDTKQKNQ